MWESSRYHHLYVSIFVCTLLTQTDAYLQFGTSKSPPSISQDSVLDRNNGLIQSYHPLKKIENDIQKFRMQRMRKYSTIDPVHNDNNKHTLEVEVDVTKKQEKQKRQRKRNSNSSNQPTAVPGRWRKFRERRLPRFLQKPRPIPREESANLKESDSSNTEEDRYKFRNNNNRRNIINNRFRRNRKRNNIVHKDPDSNLDLKQTSQPEVSTIKELLDTPVQDENDSLSKENQSDREAMITNEQKKTKRERIEFSAKETSTRILKLDEKSNALFIEYMTQPVEDYSLLSFSEPTNQNISARRWIVRRLTKEEASRYNSRSGNENEENFKDNYFRLAAPLMPLIGLDLTPVIDLEVTPPLTPDPALQGDNVTSDTDDQNASSSSLGSRLKRRISSVVGMDVYNYQKNDTVQIKSMRVDLLSTDEEIHNAMKRRGPDSKRIERRNNGAFFKNNIVLPRATSVSSNKDVQEFGNEAIGFFGKIDANLHPHLEFDSSISWSTLDDDGKKDRKKIEVKIKSSITVSLSIPSVDLPIPLPSTMILNQIGSLIAKRVMGLALPRFLNQLGKIQCISVNKYWFSL